MDRHFDNPENTKLVGNISDKIGIQVLKVFRLENGNILLKEQCDDFFYEEITPEEFKEWVAELTRFIT